MGKPLSDERKVQIRAAHAAEPDALGPRLGILAVDGNIPIELIAKLLAVAPPTIYRWMYGEAHPRDADKILKIQRLMMVLQRAADAGDLPLEGTLGERTQKAIALVTKYKGSSKAA